MVIQASYFHWSPITVRLEVSVEESFVQRLYDRRVTTALQFRDFPVSGSRY